MNENISIAIEVREDTSRQNPGILSGVIISYGERAKDRAEIFEQNSLTWPDGGIVLNRQHSRGNPIMRIVPEIKGNAVIVDQPLPDTTAGRDAAIEIRGGLFKGLSIEFQAKRATYRGGVRYIQEAMLYAVGLVDSPSYAGSLAEVRNKQKGRKFWL